MRDKEEEGNKWEDIEIMIISHIRDGTIVADSHLRIISHRKI